MDEMIHHTRAVRRGVKRALLVADMPYGSFHLGTEHAVGNAIRFVKEAGAQAVKIEGARPELVAAMSAAEVPVMAHLGLTPQSLHRFGGFKVQGRDDAARRFILEGAEAVEKADHLRVQTGAAVMVLHHPPKAGGGGRGAGAWEGGAVAGTRGEIRFSRLPGIGVWQWGWPPVQVADRDPAEPGRFRVLRQG